MRKAAHIVLRKAERLRLAGDLEAAAGLLQEAIDADHPDFRLRIRLAVVSGDYQKLKEYVNRGNKNAPAYLFIALDAWRRGDAGEAEEYCKEGLSISPENISLSVLEAVIGFKKGSTGQLAAVVDKIPHASIEIQAAALLAVETLIITRRPGDSGAMEKEAALGGPIGWALDRLDDFAVIAYWLLWKILNPLVNIADSNRRAVYSLVIDGDLMEGMRRKKEAARYFNRALEIDPDNPEALESMLNISLESQALDDAKRSLEKLWDHVSENDVSPYLVKCKADIFFGGNKYSEAEPLYEKICETLKLDYMNPYRLGLCKLRLEDIRGAEEWFGKALRLIHPGLVAKRVESIGKGY